MQIVMLLGTKLQSKIPWFVLITFPEMIRIPAKEIAEACKKASNSTFWYQFTKSIFLGPLVANLNGKVTLVGVTSFGIGCAGRYPGVYARVTSQKSWILQNSDAGSCQ